MKIPGYHASLEQLLILINKKLLSFNLGKITNRASCAPVRTFLVFCMHQFEFDVVRLLFVRYQVIANWMTLDNILIIYYYRTAGTRDPTRYQVRYLQYARTTFCVFPVKRLVQNWSTGILPVFSSTICHARPPIPVRAASILLLFFHNNHRIDHSVSR